MRWPQFEEKLEACEFVTLVGPLHSGPHTAQRPTIYVDGGSHFQTPSTKFPTISIGDGDSSPSKLDEVLPSEKEYSDLAYVLNHLPVSIRKVELLGFLGGRKDHELLVLGEVHRYLKGRPYCTQALFADQIVAFSHGELELAIQGTFSVVAFSPGPVEISGDCRYHHSGMLPALSSLGLSNEGSGAVHFHSQEPCFIFMPSARQS